MTLKVGMIYNSHGEYMIVNEVSEDGWSSIKLHDFVLENTVVEYNGSFLTLNELIKNEMEHQIKIRKWL